MPPDPQPLPGTSLEGTRLVPQPPTTVTQIHVNRDGTRFGPYSLEEANRYLDVGHLLPTDLAWYEGAPAWMPLMSVAGIKPRATSPPPPPPRSLATAGMYPENTRTSIRKTPLMLFAFLLGGGGGHKFYTGNWDWGILYIIFCWTLIPLLISGIELIRYAFRDEAALQQAYQRGAGKPFGFLW